MVCVRHLRLLCACSDYETAQESPTETTTTTTGGPEMYTRLQQPTTLDDADTNNPASVAIDGDVVALPPRVHAYENVAEQSGMGKYYSFVYGVCKFGNISKFLCLRTFQGSVEPIPLSPTLTFDFYLPKFNHLVPCGQGYDWRSLMTIGLELAPGTCSQTYLCIYLYIYVHTDAGENITSHHLRWGGGNKSCTVSVRHRSFLCACSDYETPQQTPTTTTATDGTEMYTRLQQQTTPADEDPNSSAAADGGVDGDETPVPTDVALSPPSVHAYENTAAV